MRAPTLRQVEADLTRIGALVPRLRQAAAWTWPLAYDRSRAEVVAHSAGEVGRPVEAAVSSEGSPEWVRRQEIARAGVLIGRASELLGQAGDCLRRAQGEGAPPPPPAATGPPLVSQAELRRARAAKVRRDSARPPGVGFGEY